jgi:hypothetical protein
MIELKRTGWHIARFIAALFLTLAAWLLIIFGTILCLDTFISKSHLVPNVWIEFLVGAFMILAGHSTRTVIRWLTQKPSQA